MKTNRLTDRVALITGAAKGIGKAIALKMIKEGAAVVLIDVLQDDLSLVEKEIKSNGGRVVSFKTNIASKSEVNENIKKAYKHFEKIDILVNNAGIVAPAILEDVTEEDWKSVVSVNLQGTCNCVQAVVPSMKKHKYGKIVNIGSRASLGKFARTVYSATKAGLIGMTRTWALELAPFNINVNYIGPGPIATELFKMVNPPDSEKTKKLISSIPLKRLGTPDDIANLASYLASDEAGYITGQSIFACGGLTIDVSHF